VRRRSWEHKTGEGSAFTSKYEVNRLVYYERFLRFGNAIRREKQIKGYSRAKKIALIESMNPSWRDLSKDFEEDFKPDHLRCNRDSSSRSPQRAKAARAGSQTRSSE
jgi:putative endonuclease